MLLANCFWTSGQKGVIKQSYCRAFPTPAQDRSVTKTNSRFSDPGQKFNDRDLPCRSRRGGFMGIRSIRIGSHGHDVRAVQQALNFWGASPVLDTDGDFGTHTDTAVRNYQEKHALDVDGVVGKDTRTSLFPIGVCTVVLYGMRLKMPEFPTLRKASPPSFQLPRLTLGSPPTPVIGSALTRSLFDYTRFPRLNMPIPAPRVPDFDFTTAPDPTSSPTTSGALGFVYDHVELQPGGQSTFQFGGARQDAFVLTMQNVYLRGPDDGAHMEADLGVQIGTPVTSPNGPWTINPYVQLTDVDRFGTLGAFHYWQPYAQAGIQFTGLGNPSPALTANLFPINLGLDLGDFLTVNMAGGVALTMDLNTGRVQAGFQMTAGLTLKFGKPEKH
jgi:peptidoglycan hydrolase-like protein with peptidoglycan-binding domain